MVFMVFTHLSTVFTPGFYGFYSCYKFPSDPHVCQRQTPDVNCCSALGKDIAAAQFPCNHGRNAGRSFRIISTQSTPCQLPINFMNKLKARVLPVPFQLPRINEAMSWDEKSMPKLAALFCTSLLEGLMGLRGLQGNWKLSSFNPGLNLTSDFPLESYYPSPPRSRAGGRGGQPSVRKVIRGKFEVMFSPRRW